MVRRVMLHGSVLARARKPHSRIFVRVIMVVQEAVVLEIAVAKSPLVSSKRRRQRVSGCGSCHRPVGVVLLARVVPTEVFLCIGSISGVLRTFGWRHGEAGHSENFGDDASGVPLDVVDVGV